MESKSAQAFQNLSGNDKVAKALSEGGNISIFVNLARSFNRLVAEEAAGGLWSLSFFEEHEGTIADVGGVKALVDLIFKWSKYTGGEGVLEGAAGALANLALNVRCSIEISSVAGALDALVQLTHSPHDGVKAEAAAALRNLSIDDTNHEAIAAAGGVEALVSLSQSHSNASRKVQMMAAGAIWELSASEETRIAIGRGGGVAPLIALAQSDAEDVHENAAGSLAGLALNPGNALRIIVEGGVSALVHLCSSSASKLACFLSTIALSYICDGRVDEIALRGTSWSSKSGNLDGARRKTLKHIEGFVMSFCDPQALSAAAASSAPAALAQVIESAYIQEVGQRLCCLEADIGRFVDMLQNPCPTLKSFAAFALLQFTMPDGEHAGKHVSLLQNTVAPDVLHVTAEVLDVPLEAKIFARIVLRNLEQHQMESLP